MKPITIHWNCIERLKVILWSKSKAESGSSTLCYVKSKKLTTMTTRWSEIEINDWRRHIVLRSSLRTFLDFGSCWLCSQSEEMFKSPLSSYVQDHRLPTLCVLDKKYKLGVDLFLPKINKFMSCNSGFVWGKVGGFLAITWASLSFTPPPNKGT